MPRRSGVGHADTLLERWDVVYCAVTGVARHFHDLSQLLAPLMNRCRGVEVHNSWFVFSLEPRCASVEHAANAVMREGLPACLHRFT